VCRDGEVPAKTRLLYVINCENVDNLRGIARFGGEGRAAKVYTDSVEGVSSVESILTASPGLYIALSPIPLIPKAENVIYLEPENFLGLERVEEIVGILPTTPGKPPKVVVEALGLGFYEVKRVRRPVIVALPPGTVLRIGRGLSDVVHPLLETLYSIGFASLVPLKR
jgi:CRISPR-associated protein Cmr3